MRFVPCLSTIGVRRPWRCSRGAAGVATLVAGAFLMLVSIIGLTQILMARAIRHSWMVFGTFDSAICQTHDWHS
jgi:hypothetical protein